MNGSIGARRTRVQNFRIYLSKTLWTFWPLCGKHVICVVALQLLSYLQLLSFGVGSAFNVRCTCYWPYAVRSSNIISKVFADMPCNNGHRSEKTGKIWLNRTEARYCCWPFFKVRGWSGLFFAASARRRPSTKKLDMCPSFAVHGCSWRSVVCQICDVRVDISSGIRGWQKKWVFQLEPARKRNQGRREGQMSWHTRHAAGRIRTHINGNT